MVNTGDRQSTVGLKKSRSQCTGRQIIPEDHERVEAVEVIIGKTNSINCVTWKAIRGRRQKRKELAVRVSSRILGNERKNSDWSGGCRQEGLRGRLGPSKKEGVE